jgi:hypothetical protein
MKKLNLPPVLVVSLVARNPEPSDNEKIFNNAADRNVTCYIIKGTQVGECSNAEN